MIVGAWKAMYISSMHGNSTATLGLPDLDLTDLTGLQRLRTTHHVDIPRDPAFLENLRWPYGEVDDGEQQHWKRVQDVESDFAMSQSRACSGCIFGNPIA